MFCKLPRSFTFHTLMYHYPGCLCSNTNTIQTINDPILENHTFWHIGLISFFIAKMKHRVVIYLVLKFCDDILKHFKDMTNLLSNIQQINLSLLIYSTVQ